MVRVKSIEKLCDYNEQREKRIAKKSRVIGTITTWIFIHFKVISR